MSKSRLPVTDESKAVDVAFSELQADVAAEVAAKKKACAWDITKKVGQAFVSAGLTFMFADATFVPAIASGYGVPHDGIKFVGDWNDFLKNAPTFLASDVLNRSAGFDTGVEKLSWLNSALARCLTTVCTVGTQIGVDQLMEHFNLYPEEPKAKGASKAAVAALGGMLGCGVEAAVVACAAWKKDTKSVSVASSSAVTFVAAKKDEAKTPLLDQKDKEGDLEMGVRPKA